MNRIEAKQGGYLTQVGNVKDRQYCKAATGINATSDKWRDATDIEIEEYELTLIQENENNIEQVY